MKNPVGFHARDSRTKNSVEFFMPETPGRKIPWNFSCRRLQDEKFHGIFHARDSRTKNSVEFSMPETPGRKIPWNFPFWRLLCPPLPFFNGVIMVKRF
jgi:hypothetical protein